MKNEERRKRLQGLCITIALLLIMPAVCRAEIITIGIKAQVGGVHDPMGYLGGAIAQDDYLTGYYVFNSLTLDSEPSTIYGIYEYDTSPFGFWVSGNGLTFGTNSANVKFTIGVKNNSDQPSPADSYNVSAGGGENTLLSLPNGTVVTDMFWQLDDFSAAAFSSDALPATPPVLERWNDGNYLYIEGGPRDTKFFIGSHVTEVWIIPEPAMILLVTFGIPLMRRFAR